MSSTRFSRIPKAGRILLAVAGGVMLVVVIGLGLGFFVQVLWNRTIAEIFAVPTISYWQAVGLFILAKFFFGLGTSGNRARHKRKTTHDRCRGVKLDDGPGPAPTSTLTDDAMFKKYWQAEGKNAYEAFLAARREGQENASESDGSGET